MRDRARRACRSELREPLRAWSTVSGALKGLFSLETATKLLKLLERASTIFSKCALKSLNNQTDFVYAIRRFDPSRPSQANN
jgi:hypothetical protein